MNRPFANQWLNLAIAGEVLLLPVLLYVPFLGAAFGTTPLQLTDWALVVLLAATVMPVLELVKWMVRRGWFGRMHD
jgi:Ca2+-transporting ATPase